MKFKVIGTNPQTNARMIMEFDAANRAAAERLATQSGMGQILHCELVQDPNAPRAERKTHRGEFEDDGSATRKKLVVLAVVLLAAAVAAVTAWQRVRGG